MNTTIKWKRGPFSRRTLLLERDTEVGEITRKIWRYEPTARLKNMQVVFFVKGFFNRKGILNQVETNTQLAEVVFNRWRRKAQVDWPNGKSYIWEFTNFWHTRWELNGSDNTRILYNGLSLRGEITVYSGDESAILIGLLIADYYWHLRRKG
ncbi:MAG TPA: hypothetical protein VMW01_00480 [Williamwhitmania sp.]|jgi:hypothetical protein|nr:hypothetical protein [Williamwhitmania sp.]